MHEKRTTHQQKPTLDFGTSGHIISIQTPARQKWKTKKITREGKRDKNPKKEKKGKKEKN